MGTTAVAVKIMVFFKRSNLCPLLLTSQMKRLFDIILFTDNELEAFVSLCPVRHSGGGGDLHRKGAAQCHEHLQPSAQGKNGDVASLLLPADVMMTQTLTFTVNS